MLTYSILREIQKKELDGGPLVELDEAFIQNAKDYLSQKNEEAKSGNLMAIREYENAKKVLSAICAKREEKILLMALRSEKSQVGLTEQEQTLFLRLQNIISEYRKLSFLESDKKPTIQKVRMLEDVGQYKGADQKVYGPYKKGEEYLIQKSEVDWLIKEKMAQPQM